MSAASLSLAASDMLRNDPIDHHTRPYGALRRPKHLPVAIGEPWKNDGHWDSKNGTWYHDDPTQKRQFLRNGWGSSMTVIEPMGNQKGKRSARPTSAPIARRTAGV